TIDEIRLSLNYLYYYDYLRKVLITFIEKKRSLNFSLIDFEVALNKIDKELFVRQSQNLIDNALFSIADFFSLSGTAANKVSPNSIELFLKEKDLIDQLFRLRRALPANARQYYTLNEIRHIIHTPTSLDKSERLPSKTDEEEELKFETPVETKTDESKPEVKSEKKEEIIQEEIFNFENETEEKEVDNEQEKVAELNDEIPLQQNIIPEEHDKVEEKQSEVKEEPDEVSEKQDEVSEEIENLDDANNNLDEMKEEESGNDLDSILEEDLLNDYSTDDELLDAFDSQLKALEEESDILLTNDEKSSNVNDSQGEEKEEESDKVEEETEKKVQPKIELETEEQIEVEEEITEPQISLNEEVEKIEDEKPVIEESPKEVKKEEKKTYRHAPQKSKDIFSFLSNKEIEKIVINVFNEDREDFANTMEKITECFSYDEATDILKAVFFSYRVNPYTKDAVILTNAVSNYFNQAT
ncbi:MAG: hypothetical protein WB779_00775, partial [Ignavibacteriaceae bacterium]